MIRKGKKGLCILLAGLLTLSAGNFPVYAQKTGTEATEAQQPIQAGMPNPESPDIDVVGAANEETDPANFETRGSDNALVISRYNGSASVIDLTKIFAGKTIVSIEYSAFHSNHTLQKIVIPASVTSIGETAFYHCLSLTEVLFETGESALASLGDRAFEWCSKLGSIEIPGSVTTLGTEVFLGCEQLTKVSFKENSSLNTISEGAFSACKELQKIEIPDSVTAIRENAFSECNNLTTITFGSGNPSLITIGNSAFTSCSSLMEIELPSTLKSIGDMAFQNTALTSIELPDSLTQIGEMTFENCKSLTSVLSGENSSLRTIGESAFGNCLALSSISFPMTLTQLGDYAFYLCDNLSVISFANPNTIIGENAFLPVDKKIFYGEPGGSVEAYAQENNIRFNRFMENLVLETMPDKTEYLYEETFNTAGMALRAEYVSDTAPKSEILNAAAIEKNAVITGFDNLHPGKQKITVSYGGKTVSFEVFVYYNMQNVTVSSDNRDVVYTGKPIQPEFRLQSYESEVTLSEGSDYELSWGDNYTDAGEVTVTFIGTGSYKGSVTSSYTIHPKSLSDNDIHVTVLDMEYTGAQLKPEPIVTYGNTLVDPKYYTLAYGTNTEVGIGSVNIIGQKNFSGSIQTSFSIKPKDIGKLTIKEIADQYYTGYEIEPSVRVEIDAYTPLVQGQDYILKYHDNTAIGTGYVLIEGIGKYTGSVERTFKIIARPNNNNNNNPAPSQNILQKGAIYTVGAYRYKVTNASEVEFYGVTNSKIKKITIPDTVTIQGQKMNVASIAKNAVYGKKKLTKVTIGKNVKKIGASAFAYCTKLAAIQIKSTKLKSVGKSAFNGIKVNAKIKVPAKKLAAYKKKLKGKGQSKRVKITK